jgi:hypothetical protein
MKKWILKILLLVPVTVYACTGYVIGFKGKDNIFDTNAFTEYTNHIGYCNKLYSWHQHKDAVKFINSVDVTYQLYGFSKGAVSISIILKQSSVRKPEYVLTIGAYKTTDVNFDKNKIKYQNYFDNSGIGQKSPGIFLNVSHNEIQKEVNKIIFNLKEK